MMAAYTMAVTPWTNLNRASGKDGEESPTRSFDPFLALGFMAAVIATWISGIPPLTGLYIVGGFLAVPLLMLLLVIPTLAAETKASTRPDSQDAGLTECEKITYEFSDLFESRTTLIGDASTLPHPKSKILYAIKVVMNGYETKATRADDPDLKVGYERMIGNLAYMFTCLARDWTDIEPQDKALIERLRDYDEFPEWALPLKEKYIDDERGSIEAAEAARAAAMAE